MPGPSWVTATFEFEDPGWLYTLLDHGHDHDHNSLTNTTIMTTIMTMTMKRNYDVITVSHSFSVLNKNMSSLDMTMIMARPNGQTKTNVDDNHICDCLCVCHETPPKLWSYLWTAPNEDFMKMPMVTIWQCQNDDDDKAGPVYVYYEQMMYHGLSKKLALDSWHCIYMMTMI